MAVRLPLASTWRAVRPPHTITDPLPNRSCWRMSQAAERSLRRLQTLSHVLSVKAVVLDPRNGFNVDRTLTKKDVQKLTELCLDKLLEQCSPSLDTIKMQLYFDLNYTSRREFLDQVHQVLESKLSPLSRDITDSRARGRDQLDALYRQLVSYILLRSGMGPPTDADAVRQTTAALQSVFPQTEMGAFMVLLKRDKEQQLRELSSIVTGIRLFNRVSRTPQKDLDLQELSMNPGTETHTGVPLRTGTGLD
uniref:Cilia- and flagella-associated protein 206 n=1 Tax=Sphaeramia orbicularis TaxID=375764 RepID=A0A672ZA66_9TELE